MTRYACLYPLWLSTSCKNWFLVNRKKFVDLCSDTSSTLDDIKKTLKDVLMMADINKMNEILTSGLEEAVKKRRR